MLQKTPVQCADAKKTQDTQRRIVYFFVLACVEWRMWVNQWDRKGANQDSERSDETGFGHCVLLR